MGFGVDKIEDIEYNGNDGLLPSSLRHPVAGMIQNAGEAKMSVFNSGSPRKNLGSRGTAGNGGYNKAFSRGREKAMLGGEGW